MEIFTLIYVYVYTVTTGNVSKVSDKSKSISCKFFYRNFLNLFLIILFHRIHRDLTSRIKPAKCHLQLDRVSGNVKDP